MTRIRPLSIICYVCKKESLQRISASSNCFGSRDLDLRPPGMERRTISLWVQECPHCGYCNSDIAKETAVTKQMIDELKYSELKNFKSNADVAVRFYKQYILNKKLYDISSDIYEKSTYLLDAFYAVLHAAWACDDKREGENAIICRKKALDLLDEYQRYLTKNNLDHPEKFPSDRLLIIKADLMRRAGLFEKLISEYEEMPSFSNPSSEKIIRFHLEKAKEYDKGCYTFWDVENMGWEDDLTLEEQEDFQKVKEQENELELIDLVTDRIMHVAVIRALNRKDGSGWICGTYLKSAENNMNIRNKVKKYFTDAQLRFVVDHLPDENNEDEFIFLQDSAEQELCDILNNKLNALVPKLRANTLYSGAFDKSHDHPAGE